MMDESREQKEQRDTQPLKVLQRCSVFLERLLLGMGGVAILFCVVLTVEESISRYFFSISHAWAEELVKYMIIYASLLIAGPVVKWHGHINVDIVVSRLRGRVRLVIDLMTQMLGFGVSVFLTWSGIDALRGYLETGIPTLGNLMPMWAAFLAFPLGMAIMAFYYLEQILLSALAFRKEKVSLKSS